MQKEDTAYRWLKYISFVFVTMLVLVPVILVNEQAIGQQVSRIRLFDTAYAYSKTLERIFPEDNHLIFTTKSQYIFEDPEIAEIPYYQYQPIENFSAKLGIKSISVEGPIVSGEGEKTMKRGFWHYPSSSPLQQHKNVVIIGHRFYKLPPHKDTFYNLDKVSLGDEVVITTTVGTFHYQVTEKKVVNVSDTWVLNQTDYPQLTLITCHPLWTSKQRLVIISRLVKTTND